jgi:hypothetical protein
MVGVGKLAVFEGVGVLDTVDVEVGGMGVLVSVLIFVGVDGSAKVSVFAGTKDTTCVGFATQAVKSKYIRKGNCFFNMIHFTENNLSRVSRAVYDGIILKGYSVIRITIHRGLRFPASKSWFIGFPPDQLFCHKSTIFISPMTFELPFCCFVQLAHQAIPIIFVKLVILNWIIECRLSS